MDEFDTYLSKTLRFLGYRSRSEKEIRDYLVKKTVSTVVIERIIARLYEYKYLNDEEFARMWINNRTSYKPRSTFFIKMELKKKGIPSEIIEKILHNLEIDRDFQLALKLGERRLST